MKISQVIRSNYRRKTKTACNTTFFSVEGRRKTEIENEESKNMNEEKFKERRIQ
jgi:hypothetical protein